jgi:cytochrome c2
MRPFTLIALDVAGGTTLRRASAWVLLLVAGTVFAGAGAALAQRGSADKGRIQFYSKGCSVCHGLEGKRGPVEPDLSTLRARGFSPLQVAQTFWNHAPIMRPLQKRKGIRRPEFHRDEMLHLLAFLASPGVFDPPGDPVRGERLFQQRRCVMCHAHNGKGGRVGPDLAPIARGIPQPAYWAQRMWNHVDFMIRKVSEKGFPWPRFRGNDLADLIAFLRKGPDAGPGKPE